MKKKIMIIFLIMFLIIIIGLLLIKLALNSYYNKEFNNINLCTNGFQAPKFYEKCGYQLEFIRKNNKNPKLDKYFYVKFFNEQK